MKIIFPIFAITLGALIAMWYDGKFGDLDQLAFWNKPAEISLEQNSGEENAALIRSEIALADSEPNPARREEVTNPPRQLAADSNDAIQSLRPAPEAASDRVNHAIEIEGDDETFSSLATNSSPVATDPVKPPRGAKSKKTGSNKKEVPLNRATDILEKARQSVHRHPSITARIRYTFNLYGHELIGNGRYWQSGNGDQKLVRMELKVPRKFMPVKEKVEGKPTPPPAPFTTSMQVVDGRYMWTARDEFNTSILYQVDLKKIQNEIASAPPEVQRKLREDPLWHWAGLPKMLHAMRNDFIWDNAIEGKLEPDQTPAWAIHGVWNPKTLALVAPNQTQHIVAGDPLSSSWLPSQLPAKVKLCLRAEDYFPLRIEYRWPKTDNQASPGPDDGPLCVTIDFIDVVVDQPIDPAVFVFQPDISEVKNKTEEQLIYLGLSKNKK